MVNYSPCKGAHKVQDIDAEVINSSHWAEYLMVCYILRQVDYVVFGARFVSPRFLKLAVAVKALNSLVKKT